MTEPRSANDLTALFLIEVPNQFAGAKVWRNNTGMGIPMSSVKTGAMRPIRFGLVGSADIHGIMPPNGRFVAIEIKWGRDRVRPEQQAFADMIIKCGGIYVLARSLEQGLLDLRRQL